MIFDDLNQPGGSSPSGEPRRRRKSSPGEGASTGSSRRRRRSSGGSRSSFREAVRLEQAVPPGRDRNHVAWLVVLGLLVAAAVGFAFYLHQDKSAPRVYPGEAPSSRLLPFIDPILAPLEIGPAGYSPATLAELEERFREERADVNRDDAEIFSTAATITQILQEAVEDRDRHLERLLRLGSPVVGMEPLVEARTDISTQERRHLEMAVAVSWHRNVGAYRNRVEELWYRLLRLERGRFRTGSAPEHQIPNLPPPYVPSDD